MNNDGLGLSESGIRKEMRDFYERNTEVRPGYERFHVRLPICRPDGWAFEFEIQPQKDGTLTLSDGGVAAEFLEDYGHSLDHSAIRDAIHGKRAPGFYLEGRELKRNVHPAAEALQLFVEDVVVLLIRISMNDGEGEDNSYD